MKNHANNQQARREAQGSSVQSAQMKIRIPKAILSKNHRRAYAMAYKAGYQGKHVKYVAPIVRNSIVRGYLDGEAARARQEMDHHLAQVILETAQDLQTEPRPITAEDYTRMIETIRNMDDAEAERIRAVFS